MAITGIVKKDIKTKNLIRKIKPGDIALIYHKDLDEIAAISLKEAKVKCVINSQPTISGKYPNQGPLILYNANIPIYETTEEVFKQINDNEIIQIINENIIVKNKVLGKCKKISKSDIERLLQLGFSNIEKELDNFIENTLSYAKKEKGLVLGNVKIPKIKTKINKRHVLVVVRGKDYKRDLEAIQNYIVEMNPVLIGVDGGGDALLELGYIPDILIGDMDSVSDKCLKLAKEIVVHAYPSGYAPGMDRVKKLDLQAITFPSPGTSEDIALLLAYCNNADLIVAVGTHSNMIDFLEKGRKGMASTFLVRLKVGSKLIDAKGVNKLYKSNIKIKHVVCLGLSALLPILSVALMSQPIRDLVRLINIKIKMILGI
jgi:uncharacterized membrane-anchored protein